MGTTANKITKAIVSQERNGIVDLSSYKVAREAISDAHLDKDRIGELLSKGYDPAHAVFVYVQNLVSLMSEILCGFKELRQYERIVGKAQEEYLPSFPPMSPITTSCFTMWALFDVLFGQSSETIGTCIQQIAKEMPFPDWISDAIDKMQLSRMGFYVHCGFDDRYIRLREIGTGEIKRCYSSSGYKGQKDELWFARLGAPCNALVTYHVVLTTPYVFVITTEEMISAYLAREIARLGNKILPHGMDAHTFIMKHGPSPNHWNEYIFCSYSNFQQDVIFITGIPDIKESLPHA